MGLLDTASLPEWYTRTAGLPKLLNWDLLAFALALDVRCYLFRGGSSLACGPFGRFRLFFRDGQVQCVSFDRGMCRVDTVSCQSKERGREDINTPSYGDLAFALLGLDQAVFADLLHPLGKLLPLALANHHVVPLCSRDIGRAARQDVGRVECRGRHGQ